ncbi:MAG: hypothetical protein AAFR23_01770 [Pseudomonadota bacterium]
MSRPAAAQSQWRGTITDLIEGRYPPGSRDGDRRVAQAQGGTRTDTAPAAPANEDDDPRAGDKNYEQAKRLMRAIDRVLQDTARNRGEAAKLPSKNDFIIPPVFTETKEERESRIRDLLDSALGIVTDVPIVEYQKKIETRRKAITDLRNTIAELKEKRFDAPEDGLLPGVFSETQSSIDRAIDEAQKRIAGNEQEIEKAKDDVRTAMKRSGISMSPEQIDLLLESVLSGDLVRLVAVFNAAKLIDRQLARRMQATGDNMKTARKYFAMHAALFAMLVHAQDSIIEKIDTQYLPKLSAITRDVRAARKKTRALMKKRNRKDQKRVLEANLESQRLAEDAAKGYRKYLLQQREQIAAARARAAHDLGIADNTYETVEASFQLQLLMREANRTFRALEQLEAPTFEEIFRNEELRQEFESLTKKLEVPTS